MPRTPLELDERALREVRVDHMARHAPPAQAPPEQVVLRAEIVHPPLALTGDPLLGLFRIGLIVGDDELDVPAHIRSPFASRMDGCRSQPGGDLSCRRDGWIDLAIGQPESRHARAMVRRADIRAQLPIERRQEIPVFPVE